MAITAQAYGNGVLHIVNGDVIWPDDTIHAVLLTDAYTPDIDAHNFYDDISGAEVANGDGYTTQGVALAGKAVAVVGGSNQVQLDCNDIAFPFSAAKTWRYMAFKKHRGGAASADELIGLWTWDSNQTKSTP